MSTTQIKSMTAAELWEMPNDGHRYELVRGELREISPAGSEHGFIIVNLTALLKVYVKTHKLGAVFAAETGFRIAEAPDSVRAPDIAFVQRARIPSSGIPKGYWPGVPDLAVEVISPNDRLYEVDEKIEDYLAAGVRLVWVIYPKKQSVTVYEPAREPRVLTGDEMLGGGEVVQGFECRIAEIFEQE
jgi:Uma2 family endonuclease